MDILWEEQMNTREWSNFILFHSQNYPFWTYIKKIITFIIWCMVQLHGPWCKQALSWEHMIGRRHMRHYDNDLESSFTLSIHIIIKEGHLSTLLISNNFAKNTRVVV